MNRMNRFKNWIRGHLGMGPMKIDPDKMKLTWLDPKNSPKLTLCARRAGKNTILMHYYEANLNKEEQAVLPDHYCYKCKGIDLKYKKTDYGYVGFCNTCRTPFQLILITTTKAQNKAIKAGPSENYKMRMRYYEENLINDKSLLDRYQFSDKSIKGPENHRCAICDDPHVQFRESKIGDIGYCCKCGSVVLCPLLRSKSPDSDKSKEPAILPHGHQKEDDKKEDGQKESDQKETSGKIPGKIPQAQAHKEEGDKKGAHKETN